MGRSTLRKRIFMSFMGVSSFAVLAINQVDWPDAPKREAAYSVVDLGVGLYPNKINDAGTVVGIQVGRRHGTEAFVWREEIGRSSLDLDSESLSFANDISDTGLVVGHIGDRQGLSKAYTWMSQNLEFDYTPFEDEHSVAYGVNTDGHMAGQVGENARSNYQAFYYEPSHGIRRLGTLGGDLSQAAGLNDRGEVVGWAVASDKTTRAFRWREDSGMVDLGTLGGQRTLASAINNGGTVVGQSQNPEGAVRAVAFRGDEVVDLGALGGSWSLASDINDQGEIVGQADVEISNLPEFVRRTMDWGSGLLATPFSNRKSRAVLWEDGEARDLSELCSEASGWTSLSAATGINDRGQIVGFGTKNGHLHGFLLTPIDNESSRDETVTLALNTNFLSAN